MQDLLKRLKQALQGVTEPCPMAAAGDHTDEALDLDMVHLDLTVSLMCLLELLEHIERVQADKRAEIAAIANDHALTAKLEILCQELSGLERQQDLLHCILQNRPAVDALTQRVRALLDVA